MSFRFMHSHNPQGNHGYVHALADMRGIIISSCPSLKTGFVIDPLDIVNVYNLLCAALQLTPSPNGGDDRLVRAFLRE